MQVLEYPGNAGHSDAESDDPATRETLHLNEDSYRRLAPSLLTLPQEVLLKILIYLDIPELVAIGRTCRALWPLPRDPILHRQRLQAVPPRLSRFLNNRPPLSSLRPPLANIYLTSTLAAAKKISRNLVCARLRRQLGRRPQVAELVDRGVLPGECFVLLVSPSRANHGTESAAVSVSYHHASSCGATGRRESLEWRSDRRHSSSTSLADLQPTTRYVSPRLIEAKRSVERQAIKDRIRGWVDGRGKQELERRRREHERELEHGRQNASNANVKVLIRRFKAQGKREGDATACAADTPSKRRGERWGKGAAKWVERRRKEPTRAHVLGLRKFWEDIGHSEN